MIGKSASAYLEQPFSVIKVGVLASNEENDLFQNLEIRKDIEIIKNNSLSEIQKNISNGKYDLGLIFPNKFLKNIEEEKNVEIELIHQGTDLKTEKIFSIISDYEKSIVTNRMDSLGIKNSVINPITIKETNTYQFIQAADSNIRHYLPSVLFLFSFLGLLFPCSISLYNLSKDNQLGGTPIWDRILGVSFFGLISALLLIVSFWQSINISEGHPAFLKGMVKKYLSLKNVFHLSWILFLSNFFWSAILAFIDRKTEQKLGRFGIYFTVIILFISSLFLISELFVPLNSEINFLNVFVPIKNTLIGCKEMLLGQGISFMPFLLEVIGLLFWGVIGFFILKFSLTSKK